MPSKNFIFFLCMYKMGQISKEGYKKCEVEIIDKGRYFWVTRKDLAVESDVVNWAKIFDKCDPEKQKYRHELQPNTEFQPCRRFVRNDLVERKIKSCRKSSKRFLEFKKKLELDPDVVTCDEQDISALQVACEGEILRSTVLKRKDLMLTFLNTNLEQKLMYIIIKVEILNTNKVDN